MYFVLMMMGSGVEQTRIDSFVYDSMLGIQRQETWWLLHLKLFVHRRSSSCSQPPSVHLIRLASFQHSINQQDHQK